MLNIELGSSAQPLRRILCIGAHCDDLEIGCGGTVLRLLEMNNGRSYRIGFGKGTPYSLLEV